jgi:hypothetical protein
MFRFHLPLPLLALLSLSVSAFLPPATAREVNVASVAQELDALLAQDLAKHKTQADPPVSDEVFVRRIYLDAVGRIPTYRETEAFLGSTSPHKRAELIDSLLASEGYTEHFFNYWADVLRLQSFGQIGPAAGAAYTLRSIPASGRLLFARGMGLTGPRRPDT